MFGLSAIGIPLGFAFPAALFALLALPIIWWFLRLTPPRPMREPFPPTRILAKLLNRDETPAHSPWWLTALRLTMAALIILAMALPVWNPQNANIKGDGPLLLVIDNGWASGPNWDEHIASANRIIDEAQSAKRSIIGITTTHSGTQNIEITPPEKLRQQLASRDNYPNKPDYKKTAELVARVNDKFSPTTIVFLSDGILHQGSEALSRLLQVNSAQKILYLPTGKDLIAINSLKNLPEAMVGEIIRADISTPQVYTVTGYDQKNISVTHQLINFPTGEKTTNFRFEIPVELRNDITRVEIDNVNNAGAVQLLDESNRRRLVGLISGENHDNSQPLLSPLYYISRALEPFSDIRRAGDANVVSASEELITRGVSAVVMADVGLLPPETETKLSRWIENGGMLIRFAGPRLAANENNSLLPVKLRKGNRNIGGALSWEKPKPVAEFETSSPFFGLEPPREVFVSRQVLALQDGDLAQKTWARLTDGTPLVTANAKGDGWVVLFHVSSDASWSNLPISGTFVEMLRRVVNQSRASLALAADNSDNHFPPLRLLNGRGELSPPGVEAKPASFAVKNPSLVSIENPPGFYGTQDGFRALNLFTENAKLTPLPVDFLGEDTILAKYQTQNSFSLKPWALLGVAILLILDCLAVLWMAGVLKFLKPGGIFSSALRNNTQNTGLLLACVLLVGLTVFSPLPAIAQSSSSQNPLPSAIDPLSPEFDFSPALHTRLAYVVTGIRTVDETSQAGLRGLTRFLTQRTAVEPADPIGVDISIDELAFYPILYWPIHTASKMPDPTTMARIDAYMKQGGSVLFDTRDQGAGFLGGSSTSPEAIHLQRILSDLDIPPLEPVPDDHVLTKSFFILAEFPGRYSGGELWVEQLVRSRENNARPVRRGDGVSSILVTSNDLAGAWAIDSQSRPMFPIVPPNPVQREIAFRVGVNLVMYAMTGNYKSDQVHIPALLERLGQ